VGETGKAEAQLIPILELEAGKAHRRGAEFAEGALRKTITEFQI
jgi:hypothetical protein